MPTRFGSTPTQVRALFDQCGGHWMSDALLGKPVCILYLSHLNLIMLSYVVAIGWHLLLNRLARRWSRDYGTHLCTIFCSSWDDLRTTRLQEQKSKKYRRGARWITIW